MNKKVNDGSATPPGAVELGTAEDIKEPLPEPTFMERGKASFMGTVREAANYKELKGTPYGLKPILVLTVLLAVTAVDSQIFGLVAPDVRKELKLDLAPMLNVLGLVGFFLIFFTIGIAYLADRINRVWIVGAGTILAGLGSVMTSRSSTLGTLGVSRGADSVGSQALNTPAFSLVADYYPPESRGKAFALVGLLTRFAPLLAPLVIAGLVSVATTDPDLPNWRFPFLLSGPILVIAGIVVLFVMKEPIRGYMERKALGASEEVARRPEEKVSFGEAWRISWSIRTLRRLFMSDVVGFAGDRIFVGVYAFFLLETYGLGIQGRANLNFAAGIAALPFGFLAGGVVDVLMRRRPQRVLIFNGLLSMVGSLFVGLIAMKPPFAVLVAVIFVYGAASSLVGPARNALFAQILPANVRTLGLSVRNLSAIPGYIIYFGVINTILTRYGLQGALFACVPIFLISDIVALSAAGFFERDMRSSFAASLASEEWRRSQESGTGKMLVCRDVDVEYDGVQVLFGVDFDVEEGQVIALLGTNGAGKSTLLRAISGTQEASSGAIVFDGRDITHMPPHEVARRQVIHMPGGRGTFPGLTVRENVLLGNWMADEDEGKARLQEVYEIFPILAERQNELASALSGGEQQMLSLAQAFLGNPRLLMIDELSLGLSPAVVQQLTGIVKEFNRRGITIIIVEQSVNVALTVAEKAIFMEKGEVKFFGNTADLLARPDILRAIYVKGSAALIEGAPATALKSERELRRYELEQSRPLLEVKDLTKRFGGITAVEGVSFDLREGEALGLIGPNGAGKTTIFDLISGYQQADEGQVLFEGLDVTTLRPDELARKRLVRRFQDARMFPSLTVYENILVALERKLEVRSFVFTALQVPQVRQSERRARLRAEKLIELLDLGPFRDKFVKELSTGLRRISDLACVLAAEPRVLLLDEPSSGIAQAESEGLGPLLRRVRFETGCSMLVIEHDMPLISAISDELIALDQGKTLLRGTPDEVLNDERVIESYLGTSQEVIQRSGVLT